MSTAIILSAFGTSRQESLDVFESVRKLIAVKFQIEDVTWAFTSSMIRKKLAVANVTIQSPAELLSHYISSGKERVYILPFQIVPGGEFDRMCSEVSVWGDSVSVAQPLLRTKDDIPTVIDILLSRFTEYEKSEGIIIAGHGSGSHVSDQMYLDIDSYLSSINPLFRCATLETMPSFSSVLSYFVDRNCRSMRIIPLLFGTGKHLLEDIAGESEASWLSQLLSQNIVTTVDMTPLSEQNDFLQIWLSRLADCIDAK